MPSTIDVQDQVRRLEAARKKAEELSREKSRLSGELGALKAQVEEQEKTCKAEYGCSIAELPALIEKMKKEAERAITNAEILLGLREGVVTPSDSGWGPAVSVSTAPASKKPEFRSMPRVPDVPFDDGDGLP